MSDLKNVQDLIRRIEMDACPGLGDLGDQCIASLDSLKCVLDCFERGSEELKIDSYELLNRLNGALRQFRHNSDYYPGFVFGYDKHEIDGLVSDLIAVRESSATPAPSSVPPSIQDPDAYCVVDHQGEIGYTVMVKDDENYVPGQASEIARHFCHEHINDAAGSGIEGAGKWVVRPLIIGVNRQQSMNYRSLSHAAENERN
jgi:hypothetical protein